MAIQTHSASSMVASSQRPIPLIKRVDLKKERIEFLGVGSWVIKDPVGLKYHRLQPEQYYVLTLLNGERSLEEIRDALIKEYPTVHLTLSEVQNLVTDLHNKRLVYSDRAAQGASLLKQHQEEKVKKLKQTLKNILFLRLPGWDPESTLQLMHPFISWMFRKWAVWITLLFVFSAWILLGVNFRQFKADIPEFQQFFGWPNLLFMWITLAGAKILHEFGHGLSCKEYGGECHEMGVMLLVFSPCLYCDVTDSWMLKNKWRRIIIAAAGMYVEVILSAIAIYIWWYSTSGLVKNLAINVFFVTTITTVIFNANPLMRFDGYYMMSDWLEIPNLRPKADKMLKEKFGWYCLGIEKKPDPFMPQTGVFYFVAFSIAAAIYRWMIMFGIILFLYTVLKPYKLQSIGIAMAVCSAAGIVIGLGTNIYQQINAPRIDPLSKPKMIISSSLLVCIVVGALCIPLSFMHIESSFLVEPKGVQHVYVNTPGELIEVRVEPGDYVEQGEVLAVLKNEPLADELHARKIQKKVLQARALTYDALDETDYLGLAKKQIENIDAEIQDFQQQLSNLIIKAPVAGVVIEAPFRPVQKLSLANKQLPAWNGTPLDEKNRGMFLDKQTHFLSVAPNDEFNAILIVDQGDRNDVFEGQDVELKFNHLADKTYYKTIDDFSSRHLEHAPRELSNKYGGQLPTVTDAQGMEKLQSIAYQAIIELDEDEDWLRPGMRGQARVKVPKRSAGEWLWRYLTKTFRFKL